jgi:KRAB domain-containing zinc finger protein
LHNCQVCHQLFDSAAELQLHLRMCVNTGRNLQVRVQRLSDQQLLVALEKPTDAASTYDCQLCGAHLQEARFLALHLARHRSTIPGQIKCVFGKCTVEFASAAQLRQHQQTHARFTCDICGTVFSWRHNMTYHMQRHNLLQTHACDFAGCKYMCKTTVDLQRHKQRAHLKIWRMCDLCGKKIKMRSAHVAHMAKHKSAGDGVRCLHPRCKQLLANAHLFREHTRKVHEGKDRFQCPKCSAVCFSRAKLLLHKKLHLHKRLFKCGVGCSFAFKTLKELQLHKDALHKRDDYSCSYCYGSFSDKMAYDLHLREHRTEKVGVAKCLFTGCLVTSRHPKKLKAHSKKHRTECISKQELQRHKSSVHSTWLFNCKLCGKGFDKSDIFR